MYIKGVVLVLTNFITISVSQFKPGKVSETISLSNGTVKTFEKDCPSLLKIIYDNKIENYSVNCKNSIADSSQITGESVLHFACIAVENFMWYICKNNLSISNEDLNLVVDKKTVICPFIFPQLDNVKDSIYPQFQKELTNKDHCTAVCTDLYNLKNQCIVLSKISTFLQDYIKSKAPEAIVNKGDDKDALPSELPESIIKKTEESNNEYRKNKVEKVSTQLNKENSLKQETTIRKAESEVTGNQSDFKELTVQQNDIDLHYPKLTSYKNKTTKVLGNKPLEEVKSTKSMVPQTPKNELNILNSENEELKQPRMEDRINEEFENDVDDDDIESEGIRPFINQQPDLQRSKMIEEENKEPFFSKSSNRNEIYSGEGFFQAEESHFFFYFLMFFSVIIIGYLAFHNKNKILAYALEGSSGKRSRRRPNPARYRKLESNLEEAISSSASQTTASNVVY